MYFDIISYDWSYLGTPHRYPDLHRRARRPSRHSFGDSDALTARRALASAPSGNACRPVQELRKREAEQTPTLMLRTLVCQTYDSPAIRTVVAIGSHDVSTYVVHI